MRVDTENESRSVGLLVCKWPACLAADALDGATRVVLPPEVLNGGKILLTETTLLISFFPSNVNIPIKLLSLQKI